MQTVWHISKRMLRIIGFTLLGIGLFVGTYFACAWGFSRLQTQWKQDAQEEAITLYIKSNGVHTDIVVPVNTSYKNWSNEFEYQHTRGADSSFKWLGLGWGDKGFYLETPTWDDLTFRTAYRAAFGLSTTAIHATYYQYIEENENCRAFRVSPRQYRLLIDYVEHALQHQKNGHVLPIVTDAVYGDHDAFYEANGAYSMFHTCNTWTNNGLKACEQKAAWWTPFDWGIFYHYPLSH